MKYVVDLDGTLCTNTNGNYSVAQPIFLNINKINELHADGNEIVIFTARGMNTFNGDNQKVYENYYEFTKEQLIKWGVQYDSLILGKPSGDFYIDDKGINANDFFK